MLFFYLLLALSINFLCSVLEAVLLSMRRSYIASLPESNHKARLLYIKEHIGSAISSILIFNTIASTMGAAGVGAQAYRLFGEKWETVIAVILTLLILYIAEIIPKMIGTSYWKGLARPSAFVITLFMRVLHPFLWLSSFFTKGLKRDYLAPSREEIAAIADISEQFGELDEKEEALIQNLMKLKQIRVKEIYTPASVVFALSETLTIEEAIGKKELYTYSRVPVFESRPDHFTGMVFSREIMRAHQTKSSREKRIATFARPVFYVSEQLPVFHLLYTFIKRQEHLFVVKDKGRHLGIVTLEDAIETLLGVEIVDEADTVVDLRQFAKETLSQTRK